MTIAPERKQALTAKANRLAENVDMVMPYLLGRGISRQVAEMFRLGFCTKGQEQGRLSIPYLTPTGVVDIKYRRINHEENVPKYTHESGAGLHLYNAHVLIGASDLVVVTEGEMDAIAVQAYCGIPAVAYPGVDTWTKQKHFPLCFEGIGQVVVVADGDDPGRAAAKRVAQSIGMGARVVDLGDGQDANAFIASQGAGAFLERLNQ